MKDLIIVKSYDGPAIGAITEANEFQCSILNFLPRLVPDKVVSMQKHTETDECFILLQGKCLLYFAGGEEAPGEVSAINLEKNTIYNVPSGVWHQPVLSEDAKILLVENKNTVDANSPRVALTEEQIRKVRELGKNFRN